MRSELFKVCVGVASIAALTVQIVGERAVSHSPAGLAIFTFNRSTILVVVPPSVNLIAKSGEPSAVNILGPTASTFVPIPTKLAVIDGGATEELELELDEPALEELELELDEEPGRLTLTAVLVPSAKKTWIVAVGLFAINQSLAGR